MKKKQWKCRKCGAVSKTQPKLHEIKMPAGGDTGSPILGVTVLGRRTDMAVEFGVRKCPKCQEPVLESIGLPIDEDALLIKEVFDLDDGFPLEQVAAWLRANSIGRNDLEELARLKHGSHSLDKLVGWFSKRRIVANFIVPEGTSPEELEEFRKLEAKVKKPHPND